MLPMLKGGLGCVHVNGVMSGGVGVGGGGLAAHRFLLPVGLLVDVVVVLEAAQSLHPRADVVWESLHPRGGTTSSRHHLLQAVHDLLAQGSLLFRVQCIPLRVGRHLPRTRPGPLQSAATPDTRRKGRAGGALLRQGPLTGG